MQGLLSLRDGIIKKYKNKYGVEYSAKDEITITAGATQAIFTIISSLIEEDDEVILFDPAYDCYAPTVELFKGKPVHLTLKHPNYSIDWKEFESAITNKTKLVVINTPHNPTGSILSEKDMQRLNGRLCAWLPLAVACVMCCGTPDQKLHYHGDRQRKDQGGTHTWTISTRYALQTFFTTVLS